MNKIFRLVLLCAVTAGIAACDHKLTRKDKMLLTDEVTHRYRTGLLHYMAGTTDTAEIITNLEAIKPYSLINLESGRMIQFDTCRIGFSEGSTTVLERNKCRELFEEYFTTPSGAEEQACGQPGDLLAAYFAAVREPETAPERIALKDLAVARLDCLGPLPVINISKKSRFALILRLLQAQSGKPAGVTLPEDLDRKSAAWLVEAAK